MSWYYYLESKIRFPFHAKCLAAKVVSPLRKGESVEVVRMAPDDVCEHNMLVMIRWQGRNVAVPLSQPLLSIQTNQPLKPLVTGIIGSRKATVSELRRPTELTVFEVVIAAAIWVVEKIVAQVRRPIHD